MADAVDLDEVVRGLETDTTWKRRSPMTSRDSKSPSRSTSTSTSPASPSTQVAVRTDLADDQLVGLALVVQLDRSADRRGWCGAAATGGGEEAGAFEGVLGVVDADRGGDQRNVGEARRAVTVPGAGAVQPAGIGGGRR